MVHFVWIESGDVFFFSKFGDRGAHVCASAWCAIMEHVYGIWLEAGAPDDYKYSAEFAAHIAGLDELRALLPTLETPAARDRAAELLTLCPRNS